MHCDSEKVLRDAEDIVRRVEKGAMVSYAQNYEDVMLRRAFSGNSAGVYVDVGAFHPTENSVTKHFYDQGWAGINIEPNSDLLSAFMESRSRDKNFALAVSDRICETEIFLSGSRGWSSMNPELVGAYQKEGVLLRPTMVETTTLTKLFEDNLAETVDFLKIDVEGHEKQVVSGNNWQKNRPKIVLIETVVPKILHNQDAKKEHENWSTWVCEMKEKAYLFAYFDGLNSFFIREESSDLLECFEMPPNYFDDFVKFRELAFAKYILHAV